MKRNIMIATQTADDSEEILQLVERLEAVGVDIEFMRRSAIAYGYEISWDDSIKIPVKSSGKVQKKELYTEDGTIVTCGMIFDMKSKGMTDNVIADRLHTSGSTIKRRRAEHKEDLYYGCETIF